VRNFAMAISGRTSFVSLGAVKEKLEVPSQSILAVCATVQKMLGRPCQASSMVDRVAMIEPKNDHLHIFSRFELPRLGSVLLTTILRDMEMNATAYFMTAEEAVAGRIQADLVGISTITPTATSSYRIADHYREQGIPVVMGGPHATCLPEEALQHADFVIRGEGETALPQLVRALGGDGDLVDVPGLAWMLKGIMHQNPVAEAVQNLDALPFPDFSLLDLGKGKGVTRGLVRSTLPIQTSRGCPYDCTFCSVTQMFGRNYRRRSTQSVIDELAHYDPGLRKLFFYDDNFAVNSVRAKELLREMIARKLGFKWTTQVRADIAKDSELLDLMVEAGCYGLYIGFESVNPGALEEMKKNLSVEEMESAIRELRRRKIHIHGMFVLGFDSDTPQSVRSTVSFALSEKIDTAQFLILTPLPGTELYRSLQNEGRILDRRWDEYDGHHVKFRPIGFSPWALQKAQIDAHSRFYSPAQIALRLARGSPYGFFIGTYANALNRRWRHAEADYIHSLQGGRLYGLRSRPIPV
jgi:radical SAM superfamily enzyme YgiQ (UPF0313 family)